MSRTTQPVVRPRKVWRMSAAAPRGEIVEARRGAVAQEAADDEARRPAPRSQLGWRASSHDLASGLEVSDFADTLPNDVYADLFEADGRRRQ